MLAKSLILLEGLPLALTSPPPGILGAAVAITYLTLEDICSLTCLAVSPLAVTSYHSPYQHKGAPNSLTIAHPR